MSVPCSALPLYLVAGIAVFKDHPARQRRSQERYALKRRTRCVKFGAFVLITYNLFPSAEIWISTNGRELLIAGGSGGSGSRFRIEASGRTESLLPHTPHVMFGELETLWHFAHNIARLTGMLTMATPGKFNSFDISHL